MSQQFIYIHITLPLAQHASVVYKSTHYCNDVRFQRVSGRQTSCPRYSSLCQDCAILPTNICTLSVCSHMACCIKSSTKVVNVVSDFNAQIGQHRRRNSMSQANVRNVIHTESLPTTRTNSSAQNVHRFLKTPQNLHFPVHFLPNCFQHRC